MQASRLPKLLQDTARLFNSGQLSQARELCRKMLTKHPRQPQVLAMMGSIHGRMGEFGDAEKCYRMLASLEPSVYTHLFYLGLSLVMQGRLPDAVPVFTHMLKLRPNFAEGHVQLGCTMRDLGQHDVAINHFRRALALTPKLADAAVFLGNLLVFRGQLDEALVCYAQARKSQPNSADAVAGQAMVLERRGDKHGAWDVLQAAISQGLVSPNIAIMYATLASGYGQEEQAKMLLNGFLSRFATTLTATQRQELHFSLGKLHDKCGEYDFAFGHYESANQLAPHAFDIGALRDKVKRIKRVYSSDALHMVSPGPGSKPTPVFVVGMPRSGTSLVEQIIVSHPDVAAGGELELLPDLERIVAQLIGGKLAYPECMTEAGSEHLEGLSGRYRESVSALSDGLSYVTDKLPPNYERLGLIQQLFPEAKIIHVTRNPRDTCLSCFFQNFGNTHTYSTNLRMLGEVYGIYTDLMDFWRNTLAIPIFEIAYESVVARPEDSVRAMLDYCGLAWHAGCLDFHVSDRYINTASYDQVRQPLYSSSIERWRHYASHTKELDKALFGETDLS